MKRTILQIVGMCLSVFANSRRCNRARYMLTLVLVLSLTALPLLPSPRVTRAFAPNPVPPSQAVQQPDGQADGGANVNAPQSYAKLDLSFEPNQGQTDVQVKFLAHGAGYTLFLTSDEAVFAVRDCQGRTANLSSLNREQIGTDPGLSDSEPCLTHALRMRIDGANPRAEAVGVDQAEGIVNYFMGNDPAKWHTNIPTFARVRYAEVYPGIDLVYYGKQRQLEYDFVVQPGADAARVSLAFEGADALEVERATGDLLLQVGGQTIKQQKPVVYQNIEGERREVESGYQLNGGKVKIRVGAYDRSRSLIIDPVLAYSTYLGGSGFDQGLGIAVDSSGNAYVTGLTQSTDFPRFNAMDSTLGGSQDAFVTKVNAVGSLVYSNYLGGSSLEVGRGIAVDASGNAYITGLTQSTDFPAVNAMDSTLGGLGDAFVIKFNAAGSALVYSTYVGGSGSDSCIGIAVDSSGNAYVTGFTDSTNFPTVNALQATNGGGLFDGFVTKLNTAGSAFVYSTYLGGGDLDVGRGIAVDSSGNAYVTGLTQSTDFPTFNAMDSTLGAGDAFVTKLNAAGSALVYSTYLGGSLFDQGNGIATDSSGNAYVTGQTESNDFPTVNAIDSTFGGGVGVAAVDAFVTKLNDAGSALNYSTYVGGGGPDRGTGIAVGSSSGNAYVIGTTQSTNFPTAFPIQGPSGDDDVFVTRLNFVGSAFVYSTYLGGNDVDLGAGIAVDTSGNAYIAGLTASSDFPQDNPERIGGGADAFIAKIGSHVIAGRVMDSLGNPISGVVTLSGSSSDVTRSDASGNFVFLGTTPGGSYSVTPSKPGYTFTPAFFSIGNLNTNVAEIVFTGTAAPTPTPTPTPTPFPASVGFNATSFAVSEGAGSVSITVARRSDPGTTTTIDYATTDGTANDRGDYTTAIGRLRFAPGETVKSFSVFITDDVFAEGDETINITLSNPSPTATQINNPASVVLTIVDNDLVNGTTNPIDSTQFFVRQHYIDYFNREPDPSGFAFWVNNIDSCGTAQCREVKRTDTSAAFFLSIEFQQTGFVVEKTYRAALNRLPAYREFIGDTRAIGRNLIIGSPGAEAQLEANKQDFFNEFTARLDFQAVYSGLTNEQFVDALNANTGGSLTASERDDLVNRLNALTETWGTVLRRVGENATFTNREFNRAFVLMEYFGYLRRNPNDSPDANFDGFNFWLNKLNSFGGDYRRAEMVKAFLSATEYRGRFGP